MSNINKLLSIIRDEGSKNNIPYPSIGKVKSINPFLIQLNDLSLYKDDLYIPEDLLPNTTTGEITLDGTFNTANSTIKNPLNDNYNSELQSTTFKGKFTASMSIQFKVGDLVVLLPLENKQKYVLFNKVVSLE